MFLNLKFILLSEQFQQKYIQKMTQKIILFEFSFRKLQTCNHLLRYILERRISKNYILLLESTTAITF